MSFHNMNLTKKGRKLMIQRRELALKTFPDIKIKEEKENEDMSLYIALKPRNPGLAAGGFLQPLPLLLDTPL